MRRLVASSARIIRTIAPQRSAMEARLKNAHHTRIANAQMAPPRSPKTAASGMTTGRPYMSSNCSTTATTPGHSRSGFSGTDSLVMFRAYAPGREFVPSCRLPTSRPNRYPEYRPPMLKVKVDSPDDLNPTETSEWIEALDEIIDEAGPDRASFLLNRLMERAANFGVQ